MEYKEIVEYKKISFCFRVFMKCFFMHSRLYALHRNANLSLATYRFVFKEIEDRIINPHHEFLIDLIKKKLFF